MRDSINNIIKTCALGVLAVIISYGLVIVQQVCCETVIDTCSPASNRITDSYATATSCLTPHLRARSTRTKINLCFQELVAGTGHGIPCCETDRCNTDYQKTFVSQTISQGYYPPEKSFSSLGEVSESQTAFESINPPTSRKTVPIHILVQSIIC